MNNIIGGGETRHITRQMQCETPQITKIYLVRKILTEITSKNHVANIRNLKIWNGAIWNHTNTKQLTIISILLLWLTGECTYYDPNLNTRIKDHKQYE